MTWLRGLLSLASGAGERGRLSTLIFHRVLPAPDPLFPEEIDAERFDMICRWVRGWFNVLPLDEAVRRLGDGSLPSRAMAITFDDGYADNHEQAAPILHRHGLPCTFFVSTGFIDGGRMWNDTLIEAVRKTRLSRLQLGHLHAGLATCETATVAQRRHAIDRLIGVAKYLEPAQRQRFVDALAAVAEVTPRNDLMLIAEQVRALRAMGMQIGAHTVTHPILAALSDEVARHEIVEGRRHLEEILGERVRLFAYPNGKPLKDYTTRDVALVREAGFDAAVSTESGVSTARTDRWQLPRFTPWDRTRLGFGLRLLHNALAA